MQCLRCGAYNNEGSRFCVECGADLLSAAGQAEGYMTHGTTQAQAHGRVRGSAGIRTGRVAVIVSIALTLVAATALVVFLTVFRTVDNGSGASAESPDFVSGTVLGKTPILSGVVAEADGSTADSSAESNDSAEIPNTSEGVTSVGTQTYDNIAAYSWAELSQIAGEVEACSSRTEALAVTEKYNLTGPGGKLFDLGKGFSMGDGVTLEARLVDVWHDEAQTPSGRAGLSFIVTSCAYHHQMSTGKYTQGGWEASDMRAWLSTDVWNSMPPDLRDAIVPVYKWSNNAGSSRTVSCVTKTTDSIWIPSIVELCGNVAWEYFTEPQNASLFNAVFIAEGYQYEFFSQQGIVSDQPNGVLALSSNWWLRSTAASTGRGRFVSADGDPSNFGDSNENWGVVFGFCL